MSNEDNPPVYEWSVAEIGDSALPEDHPVDPARIALYVKTSGDRNPLFTDEKLARSLGFDGLKVPASMAIRMAPGRRTHIMKQKGYRQPIRPTPFARWECQFFAPVKPGDVITSESRLDEKYEKRGRKYLVWKVTGRNQRGENVVEYLWTNSWEGSKPEDRTR